MAKQMRFSTEALVDFVREYAEKHYESGGWDVIVEAWSDEDIAQEIGKATTFDGALKKMAGIVSIYADREADAINSTF